MDDVLIVGAGPTGLVLALWLIAQGIKVRIIDKKAGPGDTSRAMVVQARTLELYRQLDLADTLVAQGHHMAAINMWTRGKPAARLIFGDAGKYISPYPYPLVYPQDHHERPGRGTSLGMDFTLSSQRHLGTAAYRRPVSAASGPRTTTACTMSGWSGTPLSSMRAQ